MTAETAVKMLLTLEEAAYELSIGRSLLYEHVLRGDLPSIKLGRCRRIRRLDLERFVEGLARPEVQKHLRKI